jgi:hemerythrin
MSLITWTENQFGCKVNYVDDEHKDIFAGLNVLYDTADNASDHAEIVTAFEAVLGAVVDHFVHEEEDMKKAGFSGYQPHKDEHDQLLGMCQELFHAFKDEQDNGIVIELGGLIKMWLESHIPTFDFAYADVVASVNQ